MFINTSVGVPPPEGVHYPEGSTGPRLRPLPDDAPEEARTEHIRFMETELRRVMAELFDVVWLWQTQMADISPEQPAGHEATNFLDHLEAGAMARLNTHEYGQAMTALGVLLQVTEARRRIRENVRVGSERARAAHSDHRKAAVDHANELFELMDAMTALTRTIKTKLAATGVLHRT